MTDEIGSSCLNQAPEITDSSSEIKRLESLIRELKLQLEFQNSKYKQCLAEGKVAMKHLEQLQKDVEFYYLLSEKKQKIIVSLEKLLNKSTEIIYNYVNK